MCVYVGGGGGTKLFLSKNLFLSILVTILRGAFTNPIFDKKGAEMGRYLGAQKYSFLNIFWVIKRTDLGMHPI